MDPMQERGSSRMPGFHKLTISERYDRLDQFVRLTAEEKYTLRKESLPVEKADLMIENVVGVFGMPLGLAVNFRIHDKDYVIPMAIEESSVVAAATHLAKLVREHGRITTESTEPIMIGQIQIADMKDPLEAKRRLEEQKERIIELANEQDPMLCELGGGAKDVEVRLLETDVGPMLVLHLLVDVRDAMGANAVNTMAEALTLFVEGVSGGKVYLRIISNLADRRLARAHLEIAPEAFNEHDWKGTEVVDGIIKAYAFAKADPYRAATHNKGVMNGIDALMIATGNDWRAIEAGIHAYACRNGKYEPITRWWKAPDGKLHGEIEAPMPVGLVGGATKVHPQARIALRILGVKSARELAEVAVAVGLVQNLAALRSLVTEGIQKGHMVLHARNVAVSAGAVGEMAVHVANQMIREGRIRFDRAKEIIRHMLKAVEEKAQQIHEHIEEKHLHRHGGSAEVSEEENETPPKSG